MPIELKIFLGFVVVLVAVGVGATYYCYRRLYYSKKRVPLKADEYEIPDGKEYQAIKEEIIAWVKWKRALLVV